jgi:hypothetical protein
MRKPTRALLAGLAGIATLVIVFSPASAQEPAAKAIKPCVAITGTDSHVTELAYHRITSTDDWARLWQRHKGQESDHPYDLYYDPLALPQVDFDAFMVIAIFQGRGWNSAGLKAISISEAADRIVFRFDDKSYQTAGPDGGGDKVAAYGFFVVPRSTKPVALEENVQELIGQPPVWKERVTFPKL